ncbi:hypothetical protein ACFZAR_35485 [Streptomyces sp. NPDC008222]|uniref:hypothetical protein n=1 Tax=Streptomyces sp. NPDC008222 TaxID=3364820 RepID=UPI0036EC6B75
MTSTTGEPVVLVSRRIGAPVGDIFRFLADPGRHPDLNGSGMLRGGVSDAVVSDVGDVFVMPLGSTGRRVRPPVKGALDRQRELCHQARPLGGLRRLPRGDRARGRRARRRRARTGAHRLARGDLADLAAA